MWRAMSHTLLLVVALIAYCRSDAIPKTKPVAHVEVFSTDIPLGDKQTVPIYTRNFNRHRQFGFVTYDPSSFDQSQLTLVDTDQNPPSEITCDVELKNPEKKKIIWDRLLLDDKEEKDTNLQLTYMTEVLEGKNDWHTVSKDTKNCSIKATLQHTLGFFYPVLPFSPSKPDDTTDPTTSANPTPGAQEPQHGMISGFWNLGAPTPGAQEPQHGMISDFWNLRAPTPGAQEPQHGMITDLWTFQNLGAPTADATIIPTVTVDPTPTPDGTLDPNVPSVDSTPTPGSTLDTNVLSVDSTPTPGGSLDPTVPLVDPTPTPGGTLDPAVPLVDPTTTPGGTLDPKIPLIDPTPVPTPIVDGVLVDLEAIDVWKHVMLNMTNGYLMTYNHNGTEPSTHILFVNSTNGETTVLGHILKFGPERRRHDSVDHLKIGSCWKEGNDIVCSQDTIYGENVLNNTRIVLPEAVDWVGAQNLKGPSILVISGKCAEGKCDEVNLRKLEADNKVTEDFQLTGLNLQCNTPSDLTADGFYDEKSKAYCLNFVCVGDKLQYRRICIDESLVEK